MLRIDIHFTSGARSTVLVTMYEGQTFLGAFNPCLLERGNVEVTSEDDSDSEGHPYIGRKEKGLWPTDTPKIRQYKLCLRSHGVSALG